MDRVQQVDEAVVGQCVRTLGENTDDFFLHASVFHPVVSFNSTSVMALDYRPLSRPELHISDDLVRSMQMYVNGQETRARRIQNRYETEIRRHDQHRDR